MYKKIGLIIAFLMLIPITGYAQQSQAGSFFNCYTTLATGLQHFNEITPLNTNLTDPVVKQLITNMCKFYHDETGLWPPPTDPSEYTEVNMTKFFSHYYPNGAPEAVKKLFVPLNQLQP